MNLSAPTTIIFLISAVLAILGMLAGIGVLAVLPVAPFWLVTIGWIVLAAGCLLKGV